MKNGLILKSGDCNQWPLQDFKKGGKFSLATSAHTKRAELSIPNISNGEQFLFAKGVLWPNGPLNTPLIVTI